MTRRFWAAICAAALALPLALLGIAMIPSAQANNKGDVWLTNDAVTAHGHDHVPHLDCSLIYMHGSSLDASGTYTIDSIPGTGSGKTIWSGTWTTPASGDVLTTVTGTALVDAAIAQDGAVANPNQGYHFKLTLVQGPGDNNGDVKHKTFWVKCGEVPPTPGITIVKTADAASVAPGTPIGFTVTVAVVANSFADNVTLNDPLPLAPGLNWSISPAYAGPGTCAITGLAPAQQTLTCAFGDLGATENPNSASVHVTSPTTVATAPLTALTLTNTATAAADQVQPVTASATVTVNPAAPHLTIVKTADAATVLAGNAVGFDVNVANLGPGMAVSATLTDPLPQASGVSWIISPAYSGPGTCAINGTAAAQTLSCAFGDLMAGGSANVHVTSATPAGAAVTLINTATALATNNPSVSASAQVAVVAVLGTTSTTPTPTPTPTTSVLGESITRNTLPTTGSNVALLAIPALGLVAVGVELLYLDRKRRATAGR